MLTSVKNRRNMQQNKKGVILVTILFVFIIAAIFITCAIMMTSGTRERVYDKAEQNQARLTVTSCAEAFYQAVQNQRITDTQLESMCGSSSERKIVSAGLPGLSDADDNCTTYRCYNGGTNIVVIEFTTKIGKATDSVKITLKRTPPTTSQPAFTQMVETSGDMNPAEMSIGAGGEGRSDNTVLIRGNAKIENGESDTSPISNYVILGSFTPRAGFSFQGDLVLWGDKAKLDMTNAQGGGLHANNLFFVNPSSGTWRSDMMVAAGTEPIYASNWGFINAAAAFNDKTRDNVLRSSDPTKAPQSMIFTNATFNSENHATSGLSSAVGINDGDATAFLNNAAHNNQRDTETVKALATILESSVVQSFGLDGATLQSGSLASRLDNYISDDLVDQINQDFPTVTDANNRIFGLGSNVYPTSPESQLSKTDLANLLKSSTDKLTAGCYRIGATGTAMTINANDAGGNGNTDYIEVDLTKPGAQQCVIYIDGDVTFKHVRFLVRTDNSQDWFKIVLRENATVRFEGNQGQGHAGIYSATGRGASDMESGGTVAAAGGLNCKPHAYIFGLGSNKVTLAQSSVVEAYIGLYGEEGNNTSEVTTDSFIVGQSYFLGRIMAGTVTHHNGNALNIPYCPDPNTDDGENGLVVVSSHYDVVGFEYFTPAT